MTNYRLYKCATVNIIIPLCRFSKLKAKATGKLLIYIYNLINFNTTSRQLHLHPCKSYYVLTVYQPMFQKLFCTLYPCNYKYWNHMYQECSFIQTSFPYKHKHALTNSVFLRKMSCDRLLFHTVGYMYKYILIWVWHA